MTGGPSRYISKRSRSPEAADLLQGVFAAELIQPSKTIWIVSPWITDIPILDNRSNGFATVAPNWGSTRVRLSQVLLRLLSHGTRIVIATGPSGHNKAFVTALKTEIPAGGPAPTVHISMELHEKGIVGDDYHISGSMNLTYNGITANEEGIYFRTDSADVAAARLLFASRWDGGEL